MNILIATNSAYIPYTKVMLTSLFRQHASDDIDIYLTYEDLDEDEVKGLSSYVENTPKKHLFPIRVGSQLKNSVEAHNGISIDTYYRILAIDLLPPTVHKILYLDVDLIIKKPIYPLYDTDITNKPFAVCNDILGILNDFNDANKFRMNIPKEYIYFNAGVMLMNIDFLRKTNACQTIMDSVYKNFKRYEYNDQDVLNELYYDNLVVVPWQEYNCPPALYIKKKNASSSVETDSLLSYAQFREISKNAEEYAPSYGNVTKEVGDNAAIIHYMGNTKPWSKTREESSVYKIFDEYFFDAKVDLGKVLRQYISKYYPYEYMSFMLDAAKLESTDTIIMGSSYGLHALDISRFQTETNISATSQDLEYDFKLLNHILNEKKPGSIKNLVILLGKYALYDRMSKSAMGKNIIETVYNPILNNADIWPDFEELSDSQKNRIRMASRNIILDGKNYFNDKYTREDNCEEKYKGIVWSETSEEKKDELALIRTNQHNQLINNNDALTTKNENICYLNSILELAQKNGIKTTIVIPPFSSHYNNHIDNIFMNDLFSALEESPYELDFIDMNNAGFDDNDFFDMDHLNSDGARKFTDTILQYIHSK